MSSVFRRNENKMVWLKVPSALSREVDHYRASAMTLNYLNHTSLPDQLLHCIHPTINAVLVSDLNVITNLEFIVRAILGS